MNEIKLNLPGDAELGASLLVPDEPKACALLVQGSGVHDRDGSMEGVGFRSTLYRRVGREFGRRGEIATLRFDKRGSGQPACSPQSYTMESRIDDIQTALDVLRTHDATLDLPLFLIGHSEGAMLTAKVAETESLAGAVSLASPFGNVFELGKDRAQRLVDSGVASNVKRGQRALEYFAKLESLFREGASLSPEEFVELSKPYYRTGYQGWESYPWLASHWAEALKASPTLPFLVVQGGRDRRLWDDNIERWDGYCRDCENAEFHVIDHMGHDLNDARNKVFKVDDDVLNIVVGFVRKIAEY